MEKDKTVANLKAAEDNNISAFPKMIVLEYSPSIGEALCYLLLSFGIKGIPAVNRDKALAELKNNPDIKMGIIDIDNKQAQGFKFISDLRKIDKISRFMVIAHTASAYKLIEPQLIRIGAIGCILKPFDENKTFLSLKNILSKIYFAGKEKRNHIRISPHPDELLRVHIRIKSCPSLIHGKILNISMGGMAVDLLHPPEAVFLRNDTYIPKIEFMLNFKQVHVSGIIVLTRGNIIAIRFRRLGGRNKWTIAHYIFKKINEAA